MMGGLMERLRALSARLRVGTFAQTMVPTMAALGTQLVVFAITARGLGVQQFGVYTAVLAIAAVGIELTGLGSMDVLVRAVARDRRNHCAYFGHMILSIVLTLPGVALLGTAVAVGVLDLSLAWPWVLAALLAEISLGRIPANLEMIMVAHGDPVRAGWVRLGATTLRLGAAIGYFLVAGRVDLHDWVITLCGTAAIAALLCLAIGARTYGAPRWRLFTGEFGDGAVFMLSQSSYTVQNNLDRMVLARFGSNADTGLYGAATRLLQLGTFPLQVATRITYPWFFKAEHEGLTRGLALARRVALPMAALGVVAALLVCAGTAVIPWILGPGYAGAGSIAMIVAWALPFMALQTPPGDALVAAGLHRLRAVVQWVSAAVTAALMITGVVLGGPTGLALAFVLAHALMAAAMWSIPILHERRPRLTSTSSFSRESRASID